jgi:hypothetical protein
VDPAPIPGPAATSLPPGPAPPAPAPPAPPAAVAPEEIAAPAGRDRTRQAENSQRPADVILPRSAPPRGKPPLARATGSRRTAGPHLASRDAEPRHVKGAGVTPSSSAPDEVEAAPAKQAKEAKAAPPVVPSAAGLPRAPETAAAPDSLAPRPRDVPPVAAHAPAAGASGAPSVISTGAPVFASAPAGHLPKPSLPRALVPKDAEQLELSCAQVEAEVVTRAGVTPSYAHGVTARFQAQIAAGATIYPVAMYYFIIREAGLHHDNVTAAAALAAAQNDGGIARLRNLPANEPGP